VPGRPLISTLIAAALLAAPGGALAQSAGDEQYQDPFGSNESQQSAPPSGSAPAQSQPSQPGAESQPAQQEQGGSQLAHTGFPVGLLAAGGALLLAGGLLLRRHLT
jgi:hypothetical protein